MDNSKINKIISIKLIGFGFGEKNIRIPYRTTIMDLRTIIKINKSTSLYKHTHNGKIEKLKSGQILHDQDVLILVPRIRGEATVKYAGRIWRIHQNDLDNHQSDFHAHDCSNGEKLDLYTGDVYGINNQCVYNLGKKKHKRILRDLKKYNCYKEKVEVILNSLG